MLSINEIRKLLEQERSRSQKQIFPSSLNTFEQKGIACPIGTASSKYKQSTSLPAFVEKELIELGGPKSKDHAIKDILNVKNVADVDLSSPLFLETQTLVAPDQDLPVDLNNDSELLPADILLFHPIYSIYLPMLPTKSLCRLAAVSRGFAEIVEKENRHPRRRRFDFSYRREFVRFLNLSYGTRKSLPQTQIFAPVLSELHINPQHVLVFYSPDIFQHNLRIIDRAGRERVSRLDAVFDEFWNVKESDTRRIWNFRLFTVIKPNQPVVERANISRNELNRMPFWHSEDLVLLFLPNIPNVQVTHQLLNYGSSLGFPVFNRGRGSIALIYAIMRNYKPRFLLLSIRDITGIPDEILYNFPIMVFESRTFDSGYSEEFLCFSGEFVTAFQVVLEQADSRSVRDSKLRALHTQLGVTFPTEKQCWIFYFTEMWPGGTSKEIPQRDVLTIRSLFSNVPIFGGRAKQFTGNQYLPIMSMQDHLKSLRIMTIPTIVSIICFG